MMLDTGVPQLKQKFDYYYLQQALKISNFICIWSASLSTARSGSTSGRSPDLSHVMYNCIICISELFVLLKIRSLHHVASLNQSMAYFLPPSSLSDTHNYYTLTCTIFTKHWCVAAHCGYQLINYLLEFTIHTYQKKHYT